MPEFPSTTPPTESPAHITTAERACKAAIVLLGGINAYSGRDIPFGIDGLAYMDVARAYLRHDWHAAINGYWGPLYSWLLAIGMWIFRPRMRGELFLVHALNYGLFVLALLTFGRFWRALASWSRSAGNGKTCDGSSNSKFCLPDAAPVAWILFGYLMFLVTFTWSLDDVTPDILVACIVLAIAAQLFKLNADPAGDDSARNSMMSYLLLGGLLAVGYYAKAILLYFGLFIVAGLLVRAMRFPEFRSAALLKAIAAALLFSVLVAPFVGVLSYTLGHFSAGDSGRLNYSWFVDGPETKTWMRSDAAAPLPFFPGPTIFDAPRIFRVPRLEGMTYAPWYDAARFDTRSRPSVNLHAQLRQIAVNLKFMKEQVLGAEAALLVSLLLLLWHTPVPWWRRLAATWFCTLPVLGVVAMYLLTHLVMRFVLGFFLVLWGAAFASIAVLPGMQPLVRRALLAGVLVFAGVEVPGLLHYTISQPAENAERDIAIARALPDYDIRPGDAVASLGDGQEAYWAHWAETPVVAETWKMDAAPFWSGSPALQQSVLHSMARSGAKAVVWRRDSNRPCPMQWTTLPQDSGCMILLSAGSPSN